MMKKIILSSVTALSLMMVSANAKPGNMACDTPSSKMMQKKNSPLLMHLPILMKVIKQHWDDPKMALTPEQKAKIDAGIKERKPKLKKITQEVVMLQKEIRRAVRNEGMTPALKEKVAKLAKLKEEGTLIKLSCIDEVKHILTPEQFNYLFELRKMNKMTKKGKRPMMKCAAGKCGMAK